MRPQGVALPVLNMAVWLEKAAAGTGENLQDIRIAIGPAGPVPFRAFATEAVLRGKSVKGKVLEEAKATLRDEARFRSSPQRATAEYRRRLAGVLLEQTIEAAWERASGGEQDRMFYQIVEEV
jgi:CO/xanthine dehydrogenase FAD-binding subunit